MGLGKDRLERAHGRGVTWAKVSPRSRERGIAHKEGLFVGGAQQMWSGAPPAPLLSRQEGGRGRVVSPVCRDG